MSAPQISVVIPTHRRSIRLRWMLNALDEQTLPFARWEVVVVHDGTCEETARLLASHPLVKAGVLRVEIVPAGTGTPARQRNAGWLAARAPIVAFTDDDCEPPPSWLERALATAGENPGAIVQGATKPHPTEAAIVAVAPRARTIDVDPPTPFAQTCNIVYPKALLAKVGGFDESIPVAGGEDTDLAMRARATGAEYVGDADLLTYHAVDTFSLPALVRMSWRKWQYLPLVTKRHPEIRRLMPLRSFWRPTHPWLLVALAGMVLGRRLRPALLLMAPYLVAVAPDRGSHVRGRLRAAAETPGAMLVDITEFATLVRGSIRHRTFFL